MARAASAATYTKKSKRGVRNFSIQSSKQLFRNLERIDLRTEVQRGVKAELWNAAPSTPSTDEARLGYLNIWPDTPR